MSTAPERASFAARMRFRRHTEESTAAGIYGTIVGAAVMAASHADRAVAVIVSVAVTLLVYWAAERYARLVAERIHSGRRPTWPEIGRRLTSGWEIVTASMLPLAVLAVCAVLGLDLTAAVFAGLACSTVLLFLAGWEIGQGGGLSRWERLGLAMVSGAFGAVMIVLKALLH